MDKSHIYSIDGMADEQIIKTLQHIIANHSGCGAMRVIKAKANRPLVDAIMRMTSFLNVDGFSFVNLQTRIYMIVANRMSVEQFPHCIHCGKTIKANVKSVHQGFSYDACSMKCAA